MTIESYKTKKQTPTAFSIFMKEKWKWAIFLIIFGLLFGGIPGYMFVKEIQLKNNGITTNGIVIDKWYDSDDDGTSYHVEYEFITQDGQEISDTYQVGKDTYRTVKNGSTLPIIYVPDEPTNNGVVGESWIWFFLIFVAVGSGVFLLGMSVIVKAYKRALMKAYLYKKGKTANGTITKIKQTMTVNDMPYIKVFYEFSDSKGQSFKGNTVSLPETITDDYDVGEEIEILYAPNKPNDNFWDYEADE